MEGRRSEVTKRQKSVKKGQGRQSENKVGRGEKQEDGGQSQIGNKGNKLAWKWQNEKT